MRVKRQTIMHNSKQQHILLVCDVSTAIREERLQGEKRLVEIANAMVSHDMRNPLNGIIATLDKMEGTIAQIDEAVSKLPGPEKEFLKERTNVLKDCTSVINSCTKQLSLTVNDMLSLAQLDSNKFRIKLESFDIRDSVQEVINI